MSGTKRVRPLTLGLAFALGLGPSRPAQAQRGSVVVNVSPSFRPGPYTTLTVNAKDPQRIAVGGSDGYVSWSYDGGATVEESEVLFTRKFVVMVLRANPQRRVEIMDIPPERGGVRLFIMNLQQGLPVTRWSSWMSLDDPMADVTDIALPAGPEGRMAIASAAGVFVSNAGGGAWHCALGGPRPKGQDIIATAVAIDPGNPKHILASTNRGLWASTTGGATFFQVDQSKLEEEQIKRFIWDPSDPQHILAVSADTVYESKDRGKTFAPALNAPEEINAIALAQEGAYVATAKGLMVAGGEGKEQTRLKEQKVVGVVPVGQGYALAATETDLVLVGPGQNRTLMRTTPSDPFLRLQGTPELAWALTKYGIYRIGAREVREPERVSRPAELKISLPELERAVLANLSIGNPEDTRLADRWYAKLIPVLSVQAHSMVEHNYSVMNDGSFPIRYRQISAQQQTSCCGTTPGQPTEEVLVLLQWDLSKFLLGQVSNVTNPWGFIESGLRPIRDDVLNEVRWRYRESTNLSHLLERPPQDPKLQIFWRMRLEEHIAYLQAMSGQQVAELKRWEE